VTAAESSQLPGHEDRRLARAAQRLDVALDHRFDAQTIPVFPDGPQMGVFRHHGTHIAPHLPGELSHLCLGLFRKCQAQVALDLPGPAQVGSEGLGESPADGGCPVRGQRGTGEPEQPQAGGLKKPLELL
jgi:hypothetical protein